MKKIISIVLVVAIVFVAALSGCGGKKGQQNPNTSPTIQSTPAPLYSSLNINQVASTNINPTAGGKLTVNDTQSPLNGFEITCPPGALDNKDDVSFSVGYITNPPKVEPANIVQADHSMIAKLSNRVDVLNQQNLDYVYDPFWLPLLWSISTTEPASQMLELGPSGTQFQKPVQVKLPLSSNLPQDFDPDGLMVVSGSKQTDGTIKWEFLTDFEVDTASRTVLVQVEHFSILTALAIGAGISALFFANQVVKPYLLKPLAANKCDLVKSAQAVLPITDSIYKEIIQAIVCSKMNPVDNRNTQPSYYDLASFFVDFEYDQSEERIAELMEKKVWTGLEGKLWEWLKTKYEEAEAYDKAGGKKKTVTYWDDAKGQPYEEEVPYLFNSVTWGDLFQQAMKLTGGDVFQALLLCHNTIRGLDRSTSEDPYVYDMIELHRPDGRDRIGAAYHFFGLAAFAFNDRRLSEDPLRSWVAPSAEFAHKVEKYVVSQGGDIIHDPMEFVIGNQGIEVGHNLYDKVRFKSTQDLINTYNIDPSKDCAKPTLPPIRSASDPCDCASLGLQFSSYSSFIYPDQKRWSWGCTNTDKDSASLRLTLTIDYYSDVAKATQAYSLFKTEVDYRREVQGDHTTKINENNRYGRITQHPIGELWDNYNSLMEFQSQNYIIDVNMNCYHIDEARIKQLLNGAVDLGVKISKSEVMVDGITFP